MTLEELTRLHEAATKAPWKVERGGIGVDDSFLKRRGTDYPDGGSTRSYSHLVCEDFGDSDQAEANKTLAIMTRNALPKLLAVAKAAAELLEESTPVPNVDAIQVQQKYVEKLVKALAELESK